ncbi:hypothetical protein BJY00DRAFT_285935 [Aspergillus carlsbadensis]|nr:hypothetical protein BJY00DRAFT_285935 [Aspergillus carlsbadensis]
MHSESMPRHTLPHWHTHTTSLISPSQGYSSDSQILSGTPGTFPSVGETIAGVLRYNIVLAITVFLCRNLYVIWD